MPVKYICAISILVLMISSAVQGQDLADSTELIIGPQDSLVVQADEIIEIVTDTLENRPNTAALYSAALPGLGQAYNNKYWKIPIIYGGAVVIGYFINYNHQLYKQYRDGLFAVIDGDDRTEPFDPRLDEDAYRRAVSYWERNRNLVALGGFLFYVLNIVDANVDAHLELFTVDDDISLILEPSFNQTAMHTNLIGLSLKLRFN